MENNINMYNKEPKYIKFSTFIATIIALIIIFIISLLCVVKYYENELNNQSTEHTLIPNLNDDSNNTELQENLTLVE